MGYDDNTPLTGVTGGGLPADIWHETMVRVHAGLPVRALPMDVPVAPRPSGNTATASSQPQQATPTQPRQQQKQNVGEVAERILLDVLNDLLGGN